MRSGPAAPGRSRAARALTSILAGAVSDYFDFLAARPNFIRLIEREALNGGRLLREWESITCPPARRRWPQSAPSWVWTIRPRVTRRNCCSASFRSAGSP